MTYLFHKKLGNVDFYAPSKVHNHKYDAIFFYNDEMHKVAFGSIKNSQYHDKLGYYHFLDNYDSEKRKSFKARFRDKIKIHYSASWFDDKILW